MKAALRPAERALVSLGVTSPGEIDLEAIAWHLGATVKYRPLKSCEARILGHGDRAVICVDSGRSPERRRFSIGHELGHWHHHRGRCLACRSAEIGDRRRAVTDPERVADSYASDLLLPPYLLAPLARPVRKWNLAAVRELAASFSASVTATAIKLIELDIIPGLVVCHGPAGRRWFRRAPSVPDRWFPQDDLDADSQAFGMVFGGEGEAPRPILVGADAWFDRAGADRFELHEQTYAVPDGCAVTLLVLPADMMD